MKNRLQFMLQKTCILIAVMVVLSGTALTAFAEEVMDAVDMHYTSSDYSSVVSDGITDSYGNTYGSNVLCMDASNNAYIVYDLNGEYSTFTGTFVASTETGSGATMNVAIFADGKLVFSIYEMTRQQAGESFELDVSGVGVIEIKTSNPGEYRNGLIYLVDGSFEKAATAGEYTDWSTLGDLVLIDSSGYGSSVTLKQDSFGDFHNNSYSFDASNNAYALFNLNDNYESFTGTLIAGTETGTDVSINVYIYLDDVLIYSKSGLSRQSAAISFSLDVSGGTVLKITTENTGTYRDGYIYVTDDILLPHVHTAGDWVVDTEATCTEDGHQMAYCTECGELVQEEDIPATGHTADGEWVVTAEATCTEEGKQVRYCSVCGEIAETEAVEVTGHTADGEWVTITEATCTMDGERGRYCSVCGEVAESETISATGHTADGSWVEISAATCIREGEEVQYCSVCGEVAETRTIETTDHTAEAEWTVLEEASCDHTGAQVLYCSVCGEVISEETISATEHDFGDWTTVSGSIWNSPIVKTHTCSICGYVETVESTSMSWLKPLVIVLVVIIVGVLAVLAVTLSMNGLPLNISSLKKLFTKETLTDDDIDELLNKPDENPEEKTSED